MRILIAYAGKNGAVQACVDRLCTALKGLDVTAVSLEQQSVDPEAYDLVVFGASVYFGRLRASARRFLKEYEDVLASKRLALFLCCGLTEEHEHYLSTLFPLRLREQALQILYFGGSLRKEGLSLFDRLAVRAMRSSLMEKSMDDGDYQLTLPSVLLENVDRMATYIRNEYAGS